MGRTANDLIEAMRSFLGFSEYNRQYKEIIDIYNSHPPLARGYRVQYTDEWCDTTVSAAAIKAHMTDLIGTECGCEEHVKIFKKKGIWIEDGTVRPKPGYIAVYSWKKATQPNDAYASHIGVVEYVQGSTFTVIEGNKENKVTRRTIPIGWGYIRGFAAPKYEEEETPKKSVDEVAREVLNGLWGNGTDRRNRLTKEGYDYKEIQQKVNELSGKTRFFVGDRVKIVRAVGYDGVPFKKWHSTYTILALKGDRAVIGVGETVTAAVNVNDLKKA